MSLFPPLKRPSELEVADFDDSIEDGADEETLEPERRRGFKPIDPGFAQQYGVNLKAIEGARDYVERARIIKPAALLMFIDHYPLRHIARALGIERKTLTNWRQNEGWDEKRLEVESKFADAVVLSKVKTVAGITNDAIDIIASALTNLKRRASMKGEDISIRDAEAVSRIFQNMDKIMRLTVGKPTDITENRHETIKLPKSAKEIAEFIHKDPFVKLEVSDAKTSVDES